MSLNSPYFEFLSNYAVSIISASLGLANCLKNGVARPIAPGGPLDGLLGRQFLLAYFASSTVLLARASCIATIGVSKSEMLVISSKL